MWLMDPDIVMLMSRLERERMLKEPLPTVSSLARRISPMQRVREGWKQMWGRPAVPQCC